MLAIAPGAAPVFAVIAVERIGKHQPRFAFDLCVVREIVVDTVAIIQKPFFCENLSRVEARPGFRKPAQWPATCHFLDQFHGSVNTFLLAVTVEMPLFHPAQPMSANIVAPSIDLTAEGRILLQGHAAREEGRFDFVLLEQAQ